jgi:hypothetical protein
VALYSDSELVGEGSGAVTIQANSVTTAEISIIAATGGADLIIDWDLTISIEPDTWYSILGDNIYVFDGLDASQSYMLLAVEEFENDSFQIVVTNPTETNVWATQSLDFLPSIDSGRVVVSDAIDGNSDGQVGRFSIMKVVFETAEPFSVSESTHAPLYIESDGDRVYSTFYILDVASVTSPANLVAQYESEGSGSGSTNYYYATDPHFVDSYGYQDLNGLLDFSAFCEVFIHLYMLVVESTTPRGRTISFVNPQSIEPNVEYILPNSPTTYLLGNLNPSTTYVLEYSPDEGDSFVFSDSREIDGDSDPVLFAVSPNTLFIGEYDQLLFNLGYISDNNADGDVGTMVVRVF